jgi:hypothetical protein
VLAATVMRYARKRPQPAAVSAVVTALTQKHAGSTLSSARSARPSRARRLPSPVCLSGCAEIR